MALKNNAQSLVITIDIGSTSLKLGVFDRTLNCRLLLQRPIATKRRGARVTLDAKRLWNDLQALLRTCEQQLKKDAAHVVALGVTGQRSTIVLWDDAGPLGPALSWQDLRTAKSLEKLRPHADEIAARSGLTLSAHYGASKLAWALRQKRRRLQGKLRWGSLNSYCIWQLTGKRHYSIDQSQAQRTLLLNVHSGRWDTKLCRLFGIPRRLLPKLQPTRANFGSCSFDGRQVPITVSIGDTQAACVAAGLSAKQPYAVQYGTGAFLACYVGGKAQQFPRLLTSLYTSVGKTRRYFVEGTVNSAGTILEWAEKQPRSAPALKKIDVKLHHAALLPTLSGLGAPHWWPQTHPLLFGKASLRQLPRLALEAIGYRLRETLAWLRLHGAPVLRRLAVSGGLLRRAGFLKTQADILGVSLMTNTLAEGTLLGTAMLALDEKPSHPHVKTLASRRRSKLLSPELWQRLIRHVKLQKSSPWHRRSLWEKKLAENRPLLIGHRGAPNVARENTINGMLKALRAGADGVEFDVRLSGDGIPVVVHDSTLERTAGSRVAVAKATVKELQRLDPELPTLVQVLRRLPKQALLYIEIKDESQSSQLWKRVEKLVDRQGAGGRVALCSFNVKMALACKQRRPDLCVGAILGSSHPRLNTRQLPYATLDILSVHYRHFTPALLQAARQNSQLLFVWTVDRLAAQKQLWRHDVDAIVTNRMPPRTTRYAAL